MYRLLSGVPCLLFVGLLVFSACAEEVSSPFLLGAQGDYLGQLPPGEEMEIFGAELITFGTHEHHLSMTPDGKEIFFVIADRYREHHTIILVERSGENWLRPEVAPFSGTYNDFAPTLTQGGSTLLFCSNRPLPGEPTDRTDVNIWEVTRTAGGWGEPRPLPGRVNDESNEYNPTVAADGTLFFQDHDQTGVDIYQSRLVDGEYMEPEQVEGISTPYPEIGPLVTPDGGTLIFSSTRPGAVGGEGDMDFWVSFRGEDGAWIEPVNMGPAINTAAADAIITLSPDGEYFFFTNFLGIDPERLKNIPYEDLVRRLGGPENGDGTIYWISSAILEGLRGR